MAEKKKISEVAKELGVSRQAVYSRVNQMSQVLTPYIKKDNRGVTLIKPKGVEILRESIASSNVSSNVSIESKVDSSSLQDELIELMKDQLAALNAQLEIKDDQINELNKRLAESSRQTEIMQHLLKSEQEKSQLLIEAKPPRGFKRWFGTKKDGVHDE